MTTFPSCFKFLAKVLTSVRVVRGYVFEGLLFSSASLVAVVNS